MKSLFALIIVGFMLMSCARVGAPIGGKKDTIPPKFLGANIDSARLNVPRDIKQLRLDFDEYVTLKDINKNLIISPPITKIKKILPANLPTKFVLIQWTDTLQANTTYNFNFGNSIVDNNEGNPLPYFNYAFSTGATLDDMYLSGTVDTSLFKAKSTAAKEEKGLVVGLYKDDGKINYNQKPYYITKADEDGYYEFNYLSPGTYRAVAFVDENANSVYDPGESVGFLKEKLVLDKSRTGLNLSLYPSAKKLHYKESSPVPGGLLIVYEGSPHEVSVVPAGAKLKDYKVTHQPLSDSINVWFDDAKQDLGTTTAERIKFAVTADEKKDTVSVLYRHLPKSEMTVANRNTNTLPPGQEFEIVSNYYIDAINKDKWTLVSDSVRQDFSAEISKDNPFKIKVKSDFKPGRSYSLTVPRESVSSFYETLKKSYRFDFKIDKIDDYGSYTAKLVHAPEAKFWLQLLDGAGAVRYQAFTNDALVKFNFVKPGTYTVRILVDNNGNGVWDTGSLPTGTWPEDVYISPKKADVKALWEVIDTWDLTAKPESGPSKTQNK